MNEGRQQVGKWANRAAAGALSLIAAAAFAAPPPGRGTSMPADLHRGDAGGGHLSALTLRASTDRYAGVERDAAVDRSGEKSLASKLDLRAPTELTAGSSTNVERRALAPDEPAFPSLRHSSDDSARARLEQQLPTLGAEGPTVRPMSRAEQLATRFRREGLPVARLFESRTALVSLGLNQRGKPGIWLIQKLP